MGNSEFLDDRAARARIEAEKQRVGGLIAQMKGELGDEAESEEAELSNYDQHPADTASETFEREKELSILDGLEAELTELEAALSRIDEGTYGIDEVTGEPIVPGRLEAMPAARTNVDTRDKGAHREAP